MIAECSHEAASMNQTCLYEQVSPQQHISAHIHACAVPFHDKAWPLQPCTRPLQRRSKAWRIGDTTCHASSVAVLIVTVIAIGYMGSDAVAVDVEVLGYDSVDVLEFVILACASIDILEAANIIHAYGHSGPPTSFFQRT